MDLERINLFNLQIKKFLCFISFMKINLVDNSICRLQKYPSLIAKTFIKKSKTQYLYKANLNSRYKHTLYYYYY